MKYFAYPLGIVILALNSSFGLEFGSMGQVSAGMGGAGVALKDSAWGLYYNPALLGADRRTKVGYSFGLQFKEQNLMQVATIDTDNLSNFPDKLNEQILGGGKSVQFGNTTIDGALGSTLDALFPNPATPGQITANDLSGLLDELSGGNTTCTTFTDCAAELKGDPDLAERFKKKLVDAANKGGSPLVGDLLSGINADVLGDVLDGINSANSASDIADTILDKAGTLTLKKGADSTIDKLLNDFGVIDEALRSNDVNLVTQNGFVVQFAGDKKQRRVESDALGSINIQEIDSGRGAVGIGLFASAFTNASAQLDPNNNQLIFELGGKYYDVSVSGDNISLTLDSSGRNNLDGSIMNENANHTLYTNALALIEIPVGYGHTFFTPTGELNVGIAVKFMQAIGYGQNLKFSVGKTPDIDFNKDDLDMAQTFGFDVGLLYSPKMIKNFNIGLVAKNLNAPTIKRSNNLEDTTLNRQVRAGVSYTMKDFLTFAFDADILANDTLSLSSPKSQFMGGGVLANFKKVDFRLGAMQDLRSKSGEGVILTGGLNLLGFLDVALQYGLGKNITLYNVNVSNYMSLRVGGQFSF
ncbi:conjugal transfer protein TraF [Helicobacter sp.]|uniref:conjugal transfer protein TraF n=1 Tax=Helicobacter sp. TaxID=218 RepID=UPI0025C19710|nr:conjugal transfer protein TraF [Helicobacter sp.]